jgi:hypothetical protein
MEKCLLEPIKKSIARVLFWSLALGFGVSLDAKAQSKDRPFRNIVTFTTEKEIGDIIQIGGDFGFVGLELTVLGAEPVPSDDILFHKYRVKEKEITFDGDFTQFVCSKGLVSKIDVSQAPTLQSLEVDRNLLTELDVTECKKLFSLICCDNNIRGEAMTNLMKSLPPATPGPSEKIPYKSIIVVFNSRGDRFENNVCYDSDVQIAVDKKWRVLDYNGSFIPDGWTPYSGVTTGIGSIATIKPINFSQESDRLTVTLENPGFVVLFNTKGEICARHLSDANGVAVFDTQDLPRGTYILRAKGQGQKVFVR